MACWKATPLAYKEKAIEATLSGYHAAFYVAVVFGFRLFDCLLH